METMKDFFDVLKDKTKPEDGKQDDNVNVDKDSKDANDAVKQDDTVANKKESVEESENQIGGSQQKTPEPGKKEDVDDIKEKVFEILEKDDKLYLEFLSKKTGKQLNSLDELVQEKEVIKEPELPEDVKKFWEYKKETGRDLNDFIKATKDWTAESKEAVVMEYMRQTEGLEGDLLRDKFNLEFMPDEDASEREIKRAKINFEATYNRALKALKEQQKQFSLPTDTLSLQRKAEEQRKAEQEKFKAGMQEALSRLDSLTIDDFSLKVEKPPKMDERFSSIENILAPYKKGDTYDFKSLAETIIAGENRQKLAKAYAEHYKNKLVEEEMKKMSNVDKKEPLGYPDDNKLDVGKVRSFFRMV